MIARWRSVAAACCGWRRARCAREAVHSAPPRAARSPLRARMRSLRLALRALRREWRSGELALLWLSLAIAVAALTGVGFLVDRIGRAVALQASEILAADMRVESGAVIPPAETAEARRVGLSVAQMTTLLSSVFHGNDNQLANVRAVTAGKQRRH